MTLTVLLDSGPLLCDFNLGIKGLTRRRRSATYSTKDLVLLERNLTGTKP